jgi:uncharacterized phage protein (TIGR01671 family)|nr:MAG TPA: YopX protein [Caudoviricetes sp.]
MREILFKAKRIDNGERGEWIEGCLVIDHSRSNLFEYRMQPVESGVLYAPPIYPETLCQFTGLCDKYGNKIWENDIVKTVSDIYTPVKFGLYTTGFALEECNQGFYVDFPDETYLRHELGYWNNKVEVRGNIFDNPELLQEEHK